MPRQPSTSQPAPRGQAVMALPRRCPNCFHTLRQLGPVPDPALRIAALVARHAIADEEVTAAALASELRASRHQGQAGKPVSHARASDLLLRATRAGLVRRTRHTQPGGGFHYRYQPAPPLVAYVREETLALALADLLGVIPQAVRTLAGAIHAPISSLSEAARQVRDVSSALAPRPSSVRPRTPRARG